MSETFFFIGITKPEIIKVVFYGRDHVQIASSLTGNVLKDVSDRFYDSEDEKNKCMKISDEEFFTYVVYQFGKQGYKFMQKEE
jgi:hypothetical protein